MELINLDKRLKLTKILILLLFGAMHVWRSSCAFGFDSANSCTPGAGGTAGKMSRRGRAQLLATIPCDLTRQAYCNLPGSAYPWQAVRRFLHDNQGLVRRMYGDMRHISVLRDELESNEIDGADMEMAAERYTHDGHRRAAKFLRNRGGGEEYAHGGAAAAASLAAAAAAGVGGMVGLRSNNEMPLLMEPHFRPVSTTTPATVAVPATSSAATTDASTTPAAAAAAAATTTTVTSQQPTTQTTTQPTTTTTTTTSAAPTDNRSSAVRGSGGGGGSTTTEANSASQLPAASMEFNALNVTRIQANSGKGAAPHRRRIPAGHTKSPMPQSTTNASAAAATDVVAAPLKQQPPLDNLIEANSVLYETSPATSATATASHSDTELSGVNIHIVDSPQLGVAQAAAVAQEPPQPPPPASALGNVSLPVATISTTLKLATSSRVDSLLMLAPKKPTSQAMRQRPQHQHQHHMQQLQQQQHQPLATTKDSGNVKPIDSDRLIPATTPITTTSNSSTNSNGIGTTTSGTSTTTTTTTTTGDNNSNRKPSASHQQQQAFREPTAELLLTGEKLRRQPLPPPSPSAAAPPTPSPLTAAGVKPLHDGQLYQDTLKQEVPPVVNLRGVNACPVKEEVVAPFWANNTRGEVLALLNLYPFEQYVHFEKCTHEHKQMYCRDGCRCEQQFRLHRLLAYDPHNECRGIFSDWFRFPSCCICKCYNVPMEFRATSRSPRSQRDEFDAGGGGAGGRYNGGDDVDDHIDVAAVWQQQQRQRRQQPSPLEQAEAEVKRAIYEHATEDWYRPKDDFDFYEG